MSETELNSFKTMLHEQQTISFRDRQYDVSNCIIATDDVTTKIVMQLMDANNVVNVYIDIKKR